MTQVFLPIITELLINQDHPDQVLLPATRTFLLLLKTFSDLVNLVTIQKNWEHLPSSISTRIDALIEDIHPPLCTALLTTQLKEQAKIFGNKLRESISHHLFSELTVTTDTLNNLNPTDVFEASKIAQTRLKNRLGPKFFPTLFVILRF